MLNFTVGPVMSSNRTSAIGAEQVPYFRTSEFSAMMLENEYLMKKFANAAADDRVVFITGSGTASMEAAVMNVLNQHDKVLIINGGSFGQRFVDLCKLHEVPYGELTLETGKALKSKDFESYPMQNYTSLLVNMHETSTGVLYDMELISGICKRNNMLLMVDAISSFLADPLDMSGWGVDVMITGSQKALACPPGISALVLSPSAIERIQENNIKSMYLGLKHALIDGERGQTPFTPAVGILIQINHRLKEIDCAGGVEVEVKKTKGLAEDFRKRIADLPLQIASESLSNALTPLHPLNASAYDVFLTLKEDYNIWVCPNGGELADKIFRVGHIGALTKEMNSILIESLRKLHKRGAL